MTTLHEVLVYRLQERYSFLRDISPRLDDARARAVDDRVRELLHAQREGIRSELDTLDQALNLLGAQYRMEHSAVAMAAREAAARFRAQLTPMPDHLDLEAILETVALAQLVVAAYEGDIALVQVIGEGDLAKLLEENLARQREGLDALRALAPALIADISRRETRRAA